MNCNPLLLVTDSLSRTAFEWGRIQSNSDWVLPMAALLLAVLFTWKMYRRDARELGRSTRLSLVVLRSCVFLAILILYLQPQWRTEIEQTVNSRVALLVDTSLSMGMADAGSESRRMSRADNLATELGESDFMRRLRGRHDVAVYRFDENAEQSLFLEKLPSGEETDAAPQEKLPDATSVANDTVDWSAVVRPRGSETRLSEAIVRAIREQGDAPLAAVVCLSDGCQNMGAAPREAVAAAVEANIPVYTIGVGSPQSPLNVRVSDFQVPPRAYPGDEYTVTGFVQANRAAGKTVTVELSCRPADQDITSSDGRRNGQISDSKSSTDNVVHRRDITLAEDGSSTPVKFRLTPQAPGRQTLCFKVSELPGEIDSADNRREADVEIVEKKCRVLLLSGGPSREYRFLRNMLHRDQSVEIDVLLQTAQAGMSQDAHAVLDDFPDTREEIFKYDCVVALDPDWRAYSDEQLKLLADWVAQQGGGLLVAAGAVNMGNTVDSWVGDASTDRLRALYPVRFQRRFSVGVAGYAAPEPWPLEFTRDGLGAEFLWLGDDSQSSQAAWSEFPGIYSYFPVEGVKPGATVYAKFTDPAVAGRTSGIDDLLDRNTGPVYFVGQFYGSGRVFYMGSSEMWRLRRVDEAYFEQFYTKLIRHLAQGRLMRGSARGTLLVDRERYMLGATVEVRALLTDSQLAPLEAAEVALKVFAPDAAVQTVLLQPDAGRQGAFVGHLPLVQEGVYRLELTVPESDNLQLTRRIQVSMPDLERQNPQRNDALLSEIAQLTGGHYYTDLAAALATDEEDTLSLVEAERGDSSTAEATRLLSELKDRTKTIVLTAAPDRLWRKQWLLAAMILICSLLTAEWLIRRLVKLA